MTEARPRTTAEVVEGIHEELRQLRRAVRKELDTTRPRWLARIVARYMDRKEPA